MTVTWTILAAMLLCGHSTLTNGQGIVFDPIEPTKHEGSSCEIRGNGQPGICTLIQDCSTIQKFDFHKNRPTICGFKRIHPIICCPLPVLHPDPDTSSSLPLVDISEPNNLPRCGKRHFVEQPFGILFKRSAPLEPPLLLKSFDASGVNTPSVVGGERSRRNSWPWMALLGDKSGSDIEWFCDGVLISDVWVLSAVHCVARRLPSVIRLEEHDHSSLLDGAAHQDFDVADVVIHPEANAATSYHDLVLIKLQTRVVLSGAVSPICLPWGNEGDRNIVGTSVTATGWGAEQFGGKSSSVLQEVGLIVFDTSVCDDSYSTLSHYSSNWPQGITSETTICAGDPAGGKDTCQGDSGGPLMYDIAGTFILAGIVSKGYGCGLKDYPGLYVAINQPKYLSWIKSVAFSPSN